MSQGKTLQPPQHQERQPGHTAPMQPKPQDEAAGYKGSGKLSGKVAIVTGGDSGIGRAVAVTFAKEGADVAIAYRDEHDDANRTHSLVDQAGRRCVTIHGDAGQEQFSRQVVAKTMDAFGHIDILVNNAAEQHPQETIEDITAEQLLRTFQTNVFGMFYLVKAAMPHLKAGDAIVNTTSVTAYRGSPNLLDYAATKGAIVAFTRSLATNLVEKKIRVNAVAPGPIWTPLIPASYDDQRTAEHGKEAPMQRAGQPDEVAPSFVFLASADSTYMTGQVLHPNGGTIING